MFPNKRKTPYQLFKLLGLSPRPTLHTSSSFQSLSNSTPAAAIFNVRSWFRIYCLLRYFFFCSSRIFMARKHRMSWMNSWASKSVLLGLASLWIAGTACERMLSSSPNSSAVASRPGSNSICLTARMASLEVKSTMNADIIVSSLACRRGGSLVETKLKTLPVTSLGQISYSRTAAILNSRTQVRVLMRAAAATALERVCCLPFFFVEESKCPQAKTNLWNW